MYNSKDLQQQFCHDLWL